MRIPIAPILISASLFVSSLDPAYGSAKSEPDRFDADIHPKLKISGYEALKLNQRWAEDNPDASISFEIDELDDLIDSFE